MNIVRANTFRGKPGLLDLVPIGRSKLYDLVKRREIPHIPLGRTILFDVDTVKRWLEEKRRAA